MLADNDRARAVNFEVSEREYRALRTYAAMQGTTARQVLRDAIARLGSQQPSAQATPWAATPDTERRQP